MIDIYINKKEIRGDTAFFRKNLLTTTAICDIVFTKLGFIMANAMTGRAFRVSVAQRAVGW